MTTHPALTLATTLAALTWCTLCAAAPAGSAHAAALTQRPLVMRVSKDEFRIAFGLTARGCSASGCNGVIRYRVAWKGDDGVMRSERRSVSYDVLPHYTRALTVDRQYFDTAEGAQTTAVVKVTVSSISCTLGPAVTAPLAARNR
jgi:hypothetical protein